MAHLQPQTLIADASDSSPKEPPPHPQTTTLLLLSAPGPTSLSQHLTRLPPGYRLRQADRLAQAIGCWRRGQAGWVLIDLAWAEGGGLTFLQALTETTAQRPLPVTVLVGPGQERLALEAMKLGAADYLYPAELTPQAFWAALEAHRQAQPGSVTAPANGRHYQNLVEHSPDIIERFDLQLRHLYVSPALGKLTGLDTEAFLGKTCRELGMDEAMVSNWEAAADALLTTGEKQIIEFSTATLQGQRYFEMAIVPEWSESGQVESILCLSRDISDRILAQQAQADLIAQAQVAQAEARAARDLLTSVIDRINDGLVALDASERFIYVNHRATQILQREADELLGQPLGAAFPESLNLPFYPAYRQAIEQQQPVYQEQFYPTRQRWFESRIYPSPDGTTIYFTDITDRKVAAAARERTEQLHRELSLLEQILDTVLAGYWDFDFEHNTAYYSPGLKAMFGYDDDEMPNQIDAWQQISFAEDIPIAQASFERHVESRGSVPHYAEIRYRHRDGSTVWVICAGQVIDWDAAGQPLRMVGCHVDITALKHTEAKLQQSQAHLETAQRIGNLGSWEFDVASERITWSDQMYRIFGLESGNQPDNLATLQGYFHDQDRDRHRQIVEAALAHRQPYDGEFCIVRPDSRLGYIEVKGEPIVDAAGRLTHLTGTVLDISDRKHDEVKRQQAETQLQRLSLRLKLALESATIGTWERVMSTDEVIWDQCLVDLYGFGNLDHPATYQEWRARVYIDDIERVEAGQQALLDHDIPYDIEFRVWRGDGSLGWIRSSALVRRNAQGQALSVIGINYDITEQKQAEEQLLRTTAQFEASNRELEAFAYSVSHDLRSPLRAIDGFSRALIEDYGNQFGEEGRDYFDRIRHNVGRMGQLIDDLLRLSQVSRQPMVYTPVDLSGLVQEQVQELHAADPDRAVTVTIAPGITVSADPTLMRVAIANLVLNAWKFTAHHATATVEFGVMLQGEEPVYYLRDDGAGFDMAYANKLFGVFQRLHNTDEFPGTGIGLATVQRSIHRHGGRVWAEAAVEQGATFYFTLPPAIPARKDQP